MVREYCRLLSYSCLRKVGGQMSLPPLKGIETSWFSKDAAQGIFTARQCERERKQTLSKRLFLPAKSWERKHFRGHKSFGTVEKIVSNTKCPLFTTLESLLVAIGYMAVNSPRLQQPNLSVLVCDSAGPEEHYGCCPFLHFCSSLLWYCGVRP